jgi:hypothetical protein
MSLTKLSLAEIPGIIKLFTTRESSVSDIPAGDRKIFNLFSSARTDGKIANIFFYSVLFRRFVLII